MTTTSLHASKVRGATFYLLPIIASTGPGHALKKIASVGG